MEEPKRPAVIDEADAKETGSRFLGLPERWMDAKPVLWRCEKGHVSRRYLKSDELGGAVCLSCKSFVWLTFPEDRDTTSGS